MSLRLIVRSEAEADIREIVRWYEAKQPGLGWQFADETGKSLNARCAIRGRTINAAPAASSPDSHPPLSLANFLFVA
jgi:hypothetical protein